MALLSPSLPPGDTFGLLAEFASAKDLFHACERVRDAGYTRWDAHSPFPVHGLDRAMGLGRSRLPWIVLGVGLCGAVGGFFLQIWANGIAYPVIISGKPYFNWQPYVPITFECGVLSAAITTFLAMLGFNQLPMHFHPLFGSRAFEKVTDDGFFISIEAWDPKFDTAQTEGLLASLGATQVELVRRSAGEVESPAGGAA
jgi:Alternative complex III, ActD subunit